MGGGWHRHNQLASHSNYSERGRRIFCFKTVMQARLVYRCGEMKLWLDDLRPPWRYGYIGWEWAKTADEAIAFLKTGKVTQASLDHDLSEKATLGDWSDEMTGYDVVLWMEENSVFPPDGVTIHSLNPAGANRMKLALERYCRVKIQPAVT